MRQQRVKRTLGAALCIVAISTPAACTDGTAASPSTAKVDPHVLNDVIEATFIAPGDGVRRGMRVSQFARDLAIRKCGGDGVPLDDTSGRVDQSRFADLELIRTRGFTEDEAVQREDEVIAETDPDCDLAAPLPAAEKRLQVMNSWWDVVMSTEGDASLTPLRATVATCLSERTGHRVDPANPTADFLRTVNLVMSDAPDDDAQMPLAAAYADCGEPYFTRLHELLLAERPDLVERHREVITAFASQIAAAGYVP